MFKKHILFALFALTICSTKSEALTIVIDYTYDTNGFFNTGSADGLAARARIESAAGSLSGWLADSWGAINIGTSGNTWTAQFFDPSSTTIISRVNDLSIANNTFLVFVGAYNLGTNVLGSGGPGGYNVSGTQSYFNSVVTRGDTTGFVNWGGSLAFNNTNTVWSFEESTAGLAGKNDFYSVAAHELVHALGFGIAGLPFWDINVSGGNFIGVNSVAANGGNPVPLTPDTGHWANNTNSQVYLTNIAQEASMTPSLTTGTRKLLTTLDMAALSDLGYNVVPEPSTYLLLILGMGLVIIARRKRLQLTPCKVVVSQGSNY